ncbi:MAG: hypothetical protein AB8F74_14165, partial [Saprospiraceae bacterium]
MKKDYSLFNIYPLVGVIRILTKRKLLYLFSFCIFSFNLSAQVCPVDWSCNNQEEITIEFLNNADAIQGLADLPNFVIGGITYTGTVSGSDVEYTDSPQAAACPTNTEISDLLNSTWMSDPV